MWNVFQEQLNHQIGLKMLLQVDGRPMLVGEVFSSWQVDADFRIWFNQMLVECPYTAFRWEMPKVSLAELNTPFECVLLSDPRLARRPESEAFAEHFHTAQNDIVTFSNLGGDATLIVPTMVGSASAYGHLGSFVREAPLQQRLELWQRIGETILPLIQSRPVFLNTAGAGVPWLHVRLDTSPKYYHHAAYRTV